MAPTVQPYVKPRIKDPGLDPVIAMARIRHNKGLEVESQKRSVSALSGGVLGPEPTGVLADAAEFEQNHATMLADIGA